jgi:Peptidase family C25
MKFSSARLGSAQSLLALSVSFAVIISSHTFAFASLVKSAAGAVTNSKQNASSQNELRLIAATATATTDGVLLQWRTNAVADNLGFNVYRLKGGQRTRVNREIIPGAVFASGRPAQLPGGYSYSWFDRGGTTDSTYYIESVSLQGTAKLHQSINPVTSMTASEFAPTPDSLSGAAANSAESTDSFEKYYPAEPEINSLAGALEDQWAIAAQSALKIAIKKDGWYRVTQPQMVAVGFNPTVDIRNLRLFVDAQEVAINTSQHSGPFGSGDYIEFYGRALDTSTTDTRIYYLLAGTTPGKRVRGQLQLDGDLPPAPTATPPPAPGSSPGSPVTTAGPLLVDPIFFSWVQQQLNSWAASLNSNSTSASPKGGTKKDDSPAGEFRQLDKPPHYELPSNDGAASNSSKTKSETTPVRQQLPAIASASDPNTRSPMLPVLVKAHAAAGSNSNNPVRSLTPAAVRAGGRLPKSSVSRKRAVSRKRKRGKLRRESKPQRNHAAVSAAAAPANFDYTAERKDRSVYFVTVLNGDAENFFGQVITFNSANPASQIINSPNPDLAAPGTAKLEIALQGVNLVLHQISVEFNGVIVGSFSFFGYDPASGGHPVQVFNIPVSQLHDGANTIRFILPAGGDVSIVDYVKLTYPHLFRADAGALRFNLRGTHSLKVDGFSTSSVRLIDYTDPLNVGISRPTSEPSGPGFAITVPPSDPPAKASRLFYAIPYGQFDQPAALALNQLSTLNQGNLSQTITHGADFLVVSHKNFIPSLAPLLSQRQSQGMIAAAVDVEDVYDEFGYGAHGPQPIRDFLSYASTHWVTKPRYVIFAGDASLDPRNYMNVGNFDLVPTKLVDATYNETASDDWLTDFDNDGIGDIPVGRLALRTTAEADLIISKIINFAPANVPQSAILVADDPTGYYFNFETANDQVQALLPASMTVQRVNVRTDGAALAKTNIIAGFNEGRALANYSGHGNVDVWTQFSVFTSNDALALTNGNKLSFVVVMDCLNGYFQDPSLLSLSEALIKAPQGGAVAAFASSGLTLPDGQHEMSEQLYTLIYGAGAPPIALGDAIKIAKSSTTDIDVKKTWVYFGDPSLKIR